MQYQKRFNPYHRNRVSASVTIKSLTRYIGITLGVLILGVFIAVAPWWQLTHIELHGSVARGAPLPLVLTEYFQSHSGVLRSSRNTLLLDKSALLDSLKTTYGTDKIEIKKDFPSAIVITMSDPGASTIFVARGKSYALDGNGVILGVATRQAPNALLIYDTRASLPTTGHQAVESEFLQFLNKIIARPGFNGYQITYALLPSESEDTSVTLATNKGFRVMIDPTADIDEQLARMNRIVTTVVTPAKLSTLDYIDLRFKERVFYKTK